MDLMINGETRQIGVPSDMPVLWVLRDVLGMTGTKFGCGMALCGACTVQLDGQAIRSCVTPVSAAAGKAITTIEAIGAHACRQESAGGVDRVGRASMRLLPIRPDHVGLRPAGEKRAPHRCRHRRRDGGQHLPLWHLRTSPRCHQAGSQRGCDQREGVR